MSEDFKLPEGTPGTPPTLGEKIGEVLFTTEKIQARITELAAEISKDYDGKQIIAVGLLKGSILFMADLIRQLTVPAAIDFICVSSYVDTTSTGNIIMKKDLDMPVEGAHILVVEDLIDTGNTLAWIIDHIKAKKPASLKLCTLLNKEERRKVEIAVDYNGFMVEDKFVVGYGMDFNEQFRTLPYIGVLKPSAYRK